MPYRRYRRRGCRLIGDAAEAQREALGVVVCISAVGEEVETHGLFENPVVGYFPCCEDGHCR